jgi:hypothetical protein
MENSNASKLPSEIAELYLAQFPRKKDGGLAVYQMAIKEGLLLELIECLIDHIKIYDGAGAVSDTICRGCDDGNRSKPCPVEPTKTILRMLRRIE